jgi:hypothetical protein
MSEWTLHWLEATGGLQPWRPSIASEIEATRGIVGSLVTPPRLDVLIERGRWVIPEIGMVGHSYRPTLFSLTIDPDNPNFEPSLRDGTLRRQVAHEVHHCLRHAGPGYGKTLGEAMVSEGLAGQFAARLFASPPEPWERAVDEIEAWRLFPDRDTLASAGYDHNAWFFGAGGRYPRWLGYTLGYMVAGRWLRTVPEVDGDTMVNVPAAKVLSAWSSG